MRTRRHADHRKTKTLTKKKDWTGQHWSPIPTAGSRHDEAEIDTGSFAPQLPVHEMFQYRYLLPTYSTVKNINSIIQYSNVLLLEKLSTALAST